MGNIYFAHVGYEGLTKKVYKLGWTIRNPEDRLRDYINKNRSHLAGFEILAVGQYPKQRCEYGWHRILEPWAYYVIPGSVELYCMPWSVANRVILSIKHCDRTLT